MGFIIGGFKLVQKDLSDFNLVLITIVHRVVNGCCAHVENQGRWEIGAGEGVMVSWFLNKI